VTSSLFHTDLVRIRRAVVVVVVVVVVMMMMIMITAPVCNAFYNTYRRYV